MLVKNIVSIVVIKSRQSFSWPGIPWVTGSGNNGLAAQAEHRIQFPTVAKSVLVASIDSESDKLYVHFISSGSGNVITGSHYYPLTQNRDAVSFNVRCSEIYISNPSAAPSGYVVVAELSDISTSELAALTGSGISD